MWLRQLTSSDASVREEAMNNLAGSICHQGWICPATGYAVPYLIKLLQIPTVQDKDEIFDLLADIASADPLYEPQWRKNRQVPTWQVPEHIPFKNAHEEVSAGIPIYVALLDAPEPIIRMQAANLLSCFSQRVKELNPILQAALERETEEQVQANLLLALGSLTEPIPEEWGFFAQIMQASGSDLIVFAAALVLTRLAKEEAPEEAAQLLAHAMFHPPETLLPYENLPCGGGYVWSTAMWTLYHLGPARMQFLAPLLEERLNQIDNRADMIVLWLLPKMLLYIVFSGAPQEGQTPRRASDLNEQQHRALAIFLDKEKLWTFGNFTSLLKDYGLPHTRKEMAAYLGRNLPQPTPTPQSPKHKQPFISDLYTQRIHSAYPQIKLGMIKGRWQPREGQQDDYLTVNNELLFRFPRSAESVERLHREIDLLRFLQRRVPLPIPDPIYSKSDTREVGQTFIGYKMLPGKYLLKELLESIDGEETLQNVANQLAAFLFTLHHLPLKELASLSLPKAADSPEAPALIHGNFGPSVILYNAKERSISGIIEFGQARLGDPAADFAQLLGPNGYGEEFILRFETEYPGVAPLLERARLYAKTARQQKDQAAQNQ